jgi:hypothetical protein
VKHNVAPKFSYKTLTVTLNLTAKSFFNDKSYLALPRCNKNSDETIFAGGVVLSDFANEALKIEKINLITNFKRNKFSTVYFNNLGMLNLPMVVQF